MLSILFNQQWTCNGEPVTLPHDAMIREKRSPSRSCAPSHWKDSRPLKYGKASAAYKSGWALGSHPCVALSSRPAKRGHDNA